MFAKIGLDSSDYEKGLSSASGLTQSFGDKAKAALGTVGKAVAVGLTAASAGVVAFGKSAVDSGKKFDKSMAQVAATMGKTVGEVTNLRDFAMEMGAKTAFSATQAADALNYMALAGYDANESMDMLPNVLNLAAAGTMELAAASDMITDSQSALGLSLDQTSALVDQMAAASSKANTSVSQLGSAILTVGGTAKTLKGGTVELATSLGLLANSGVKGAEGGTALRNIILSLTAPTDKAAKKIKSLGVDVLDSSGNMRSMQDIFTDFNKALSGMSEGRKTEVLSEIFNKVDLKSVNALMAANVKEWEELSDAIENSKYAAEKMADTQLDNLAGDITLWNSALEGAQIMVSDMLTPSLREFVQLGTSGLTAVTDAFKQANEAQSLAEGFRDAEGAMRPLEDIAKELAERFGETALVASTISFRDAEGSLKDVSAFADELVGKLSAMSYDEQLSVANFLGLGGEGAVDDLWEILDPVNELDWKLQKMMEAGEAAASGDVNVLESMFPGHDREEILSWFDGSEAGAAALQAALEEVDPSQITDGFTAAMEALPGVINDGIAMIMEGIPRVIEIGGQILGAVVEGVVTNLPVLAEGAAQVASTFADYLMGEVETALDSIGILEPVKEAFSGVGDAFDRIGESVSPLVEKFTAWATSAETAQGAAGLLETGLTLLGNAVSGVAGFVADIVEVGAGFIDWLADAAANGSPFITILGALAGGMGAFMAAIEINTMIGFAAQLGGLPGIFAAVQTAVSASTLGIQGLFNVLAANPIILVVTLIGSLVAAFITAYNTSEDFRNKVDSAMATVKAVVGNVVSAIVNFFTVTIPNAVQTAVDWFQQLPSKIRDVGARLLEGLWNGISDKVEWLKGKVSGVVDKIKGWFTGSSGFDEHSPSHWAERVGEYVSIGLANGIENEATEAEKATEKMASNIYNGLSKWADRVTKYEAPSLRDQLSMWEAILDRFAQGTDQWWKAYDKVFDLREQIDAERVKSLEAQGKAVEQAVKDRYSALTAWIDKSVKYTGASYTEQMRMWDNILSEFADDSEQYASIEEKLFDLRLSAYQDYAARVEEISGNLADIQQSYDEAVQKRAEEIAGSYKLFDAIPEKQEVSGKELLNNLQKQIRSIRSFYDNLTELQERGMSAAVVDEIRSMGVGASDQLEALLSLSDKKLAQYADLYEEKQSLANSVALSELGELGNETAAKIQEQMDDLKALYDSEAPTLGESFADGIAQGIRNGFSGVMEAAVETARSALDKTREILFGVPQSASVPASITSGTYAYHALPTSAASAPSILSDSSGYPAPIQIEVKAEPAPLTIDGREFARVIYQYFVEESNRQGRQLIVT